MRVTGKSEQVAHYSQEQALPWRQHRRLLTPVSAETKPQSSLSLKLIFDSGLALLGILLSSPLWLLISLSIWIEDGLPVFYRQARVGKGGTLFEAFKFRTMHQNAEEESGPVQALKNDPRITIIGSFLRKTALDELPQLWNILKGEMSFVGPRPLRPEEILADENGRQIRLEDVAGFHERSTVIPGLTGLAQIYAPRIIHHRHKFRYDLLYIKKRSFFLDFKLLVLSFWRTFAGRWEA